MNPRNEGDVEEHDRHDEATSSGARPGAEFYPAHRDEAAMNGAQDHL